MLETLATPFSSIVHNSRKHLNSWKHSLKWLTKHKVCTVPVVELNGVSFSTKSQTYHSNVQEADLTLACLKMELH